MTQATESLAMNLSKSGPRTLMDKVQRGQKESRPAEFWAWGSFEEYTYGHGVGPPPLGLA